MTKPNVAIAGAAGDLGGRITRSLVAQGASVRAIIRQYASIDDEMQIRAMGAEPVRVDTQNRGAIANLLHGAEIVVSALNGLQDVIIQRQQLLLDAAVLAKVPRFIPSDYSEDFTRTTPGQNRNLDLRRTFMANNIHAPIQMTSVLNGAFMDMLGTEMPIIQPAISRVLYWQYPDQLLDFTTKDDVAAFTARAALDTSSPRFLRIAGDSLSVRQIAHTMSAITGKTFRPLWVGNIFVLGVMIKLAKKFGPAPEEVFPPWQGMQYMRDMFTGEGKLTTLDNERYADISWKSIEQHLTAKFGLPHHPA
jgi:nucleoside-diphosphate-sugar epimerase